MIKRRSSKDNGVFVGPFRGIAPGVFYRVPEMASGRVANNPLGETSPHMESKIDLGMSDYRGKTRISFVMCQNNVI